MASLTLNSEGRMALQCTFQEKDKAKQCQGFWNKESKTWDYDLSKRRIALLQTKFLGLDIEGNIYKALANRVFLISWLKKNSNSGDLTLAKDLKDIELNVEKIKTKLYPHQRVGINFLLKRLDGDSKDNVTYGAMLFDEMGLGKSIQAIAIALELKERGKIEKCIIICPATVKHSVWKKEIQKHTDEDYLIVEGTKIQREKIYERFLNSDILFLIINYELVRMDNDYLTKIGIIK